MGGVERFGAGEGLGDSGKVKRCALAVIAKKVLATNRSIRVMPYCEEVSSSI